MKLIESDLILIYDTAVQKMISLSTRSRYQLDNKMAQTYAFTTAVAQYFNGKKLLTEEVNVDDNLDPHYQKD